MDEVHSLVPTKRGADLAVTLERLAGQASAVPCRVGLSATCRPPEPVARFLVGPTRTCSVVEAPCPMARRRWRSRSNRCSSRVNCPIAG